MHRTSLIHTLGRLAAAIGVVAGLLLLVGAHTAVAVVEKPHTVSGFSSTPGWITVTWMYGGDPYDVDKFLIKRQNPDQSIVDAGWADAGRSDFTDMGLQASTTYQYYVCAISYVNEYGIGDYACSDELSPPITTRPPEQTSTPPRQWRVIG